MPRASFPKPSRVTLGVFLAVALASSGVLATLGWLLLKQDSELTERRRGEQLAQAADRFAVVAHRSLSAMPAAISPAADGLPDHVLFVSLEAGRVAARRGVLLYLPYEPDPAAEASPDVFQEGERLEFAADYEAAARVYGRLAGDPDHAVSAGATGRLARVRRRSGDPDKAMADYDTLSKSESVSIDGFPATLWARLGRASLLAEANQIEPLHAEVRALADDLHSGRWQLSKAQYEARLEEAARWDAATLPRDDDRLPQARAVEWLWQRRADLRDASHRLLDTSAGGPALVAWSSDGDTIHAAVAGPSYLTALEAGVREEASARRRLLLAGFVAIGLVLMSGWYFILRSIAREGRLLQLQTDFVSAVSHEFRSPLTSMAHVAELLDSERVPPGEPRRASYGMLVRDTTRLRRLVEDLLDFRRFEDGSASFRPERMDLLDFVRTVVANFEHGMAADYRVEIVTHDGPIEVLADHDGLARALWNLLDNAIKYSPESRIVWVELSTNGDNATLGVRDRGLGIPPAEQRRIFDRFVRGAQAKALRIRGTGIGLALVRHIVKAHGGDITVASGPGQGSTFTIILPLAGGQEA